MVGRKAVELEQSQETFAEVDQDQYEFTFSTLLNQLGLNNSDRERAWVAKENWSNPKEQILIPNWGITLNQLVSVLNVLKPKLRPDADFTRRLESVRKPKLRPNSDFNRRSERQLFILLAGKDFLQGWLTNSAAARTVIVNGEDISTAIELIKLYRAANKLDGTVAN